MFCPTCANVLVIEEGPNCYRFACNTCPYIHNVNRKVRRYGIFAHTLTIMMCIIDLL